MTVRANNLSSLLRPKRVAVIGASADASRIGGRPIDYMKRLGFAGEILPVNSKRSDIQGLKSYATVKDIAGEIDFAVIAVPATEVREALQDSAAKGAKAAVILSSGFSEVGPRGQKLQDELDAIIARTGIRVVGPNALGFYSSDTGIAATFSSFFESLPLFKGNVAIVSQSGAYGTHLAMLAASRGIGLRYWVTTGNESDLTCADFVDAFADDPQVSVIGIYLEGVRNGLPLMRAIAKARNSGKSVVIIKVGRTAAGGHAASSHTASMSGDDPTFSAAMTQAGAIRVFRTDSFIDALYVLARGIRLSGNKLGILSVSGGAGVLLADAASNAGFELSPMPEESRSRLSALVPFGSAANPIDVTAQVLNDMTILTQHMREMFEYGRYDAAVAFFLSWPQSDRIGPVLRVAIRNGLDGFGDRVLAVVANCPPAVAREFESLGVFVFEEPDRAIEALAVLRNQSTPVSAWHEPPGASEINAVNLSGLDEYETKQILAQHGVPISQERRAQSAEDVGQCARELATSVAVKILSPDIHHKSDVGGVALNLKTPEDAINAAHVMSTQVASLAPTARLSGFLVAPMISGVAEVIIGARNDPAFGVITLVGTGGVFTELLGDICLRVGVVNEAGALEMLKSVKAWSLLNGARGRPKADVDALVKTIVALSAFAHQNMFALKSVELNPVVVGKAGQGAFALDAVVEAAP